MKIFLDLPYPDNGILVQKVFRDAAHTYLQVSVSIRWIISSLRKEITGKRESSLGWAMK
jgi:hypothetical protein